MPKAERVIIRVFSWHKGYSIGLVQRNVSFFLNGKFNRPTLTLILLTWRIWWSPNNASRWQIGLNSVFKGLTKTDECAFTRFRYHWCIFRVTECEHRSKLIEHGPRERLLFTRFVSICIFIKQNVRTYLNFLMISSWSSNWVTCYAVLFFTTIT